MTKTARSMGGLFDWLKPEETPESHAHQASDVALEQTVIALFQEPEDASATAAQTNSTTAMKAEAKPEPSAQEMFALLDALSAAERTEKVAVAPEVNAVSASKAAFEAEDDFGSEGPAEGLHQSYETIHALPADGWLISQLQYDATPLSLTDMAASTPMITPVIAPIVPMPVAVTSEVAVAAESEVEVPAPATNTLAQFAMASPVVRTEMPAAVEANTAQSEVEELSTQAMVADVAEEAALPAAEEVKDETVVELAAVVEAEMAAAKAEEAMPEVAAAQEQEEQPAPQASAAAEQLEVMASVAQLAGKAEQSAVALAGRIGQGFGALRRVLAGPDADVVAATVASAKPAKAASAAPLKTNFGNMADLAMPSVPRHYTPRYSSEAVESILRMPEASLSPNAPRQLAELPMKKLPLWLEEKLASHHHWLASEGAEGKRFRYNGEDLSDVSFAGARLAHAQMRGAPLAGMDFRQADLDGVDFSESDLSRAQMSDATANRANFSRCNLQYSDLQGIIAEGANLNFTDLQGARLRDANFTGASFREASFQGVVAMDVVLANANMRGVQLFETIFPGADLRGADLRGAHMERTVFTDAQLAGASLKDAELVNIDYSQADFTTALDVAQDVQLQALGAERTKLNTARDMLEQRLNALQQREQRLMANLRILEQKRHQDAQMERHESELFVALATHATWLWRGAFWWAAIVGGVTALASYGVSVTPIAAINIPVLGAIAVFVVVTAALALLSFQRVRLVRRSLMDLLRQRQAMKAALAAQAAVEVAQAETAPQQAEKTSFGGVTV
jgi:uncharacterized protein YjbI with pentapeptide repeats